jgi:hypothetical protein
LSSGCSREDSTASTCLRRVCDSFIQCVSSRYVASGLSAVVNPSGHRSFVPSLSRFFPSQPPPISHTRIAGRVLHSTVHSRSSHSGPGGDGQIDRGAALMRVASRRVKEVKRQLISGAKSSARGDKRRRRVPGRRKERSRWDGGKAENSERRGGTYQSQRPVVARSRPSLDSWRN